MALKVEGNFKFKKVRWRSGHLYKFKYSAWETDPEPMVILLYRFKGYHPKTGREWRFIQALNMNYVPRHIRKNFVINWKRTLERNNGNVFLTWKEVKAKFPGLVKSDCIRRYFYSPSYYITNIQAIPVEEMETAIVSSWHKDFSKRLKLALNRKKRQAEKNRKKRDIHTSILSKLFGGKK